jgi:hypothetical protein
MEILGRDYTQFGFRYLRIMPPIFLNVDCGNDARGVDSYPT